jgi:nucleoside-diphosphate-sugar epimerase
MAVSGLMHEVQPEIIFHMSSMATGARDMDLVAPVFEAEVVAALNVMIAAADQPIERLVMCGSLEEPEMGNPPSSPYAAAKAASRLYAQLFYLLYKTPIVCTRIFMAYGPGQLRSKFIPYAISALARNEPLRVASPDRMIDWVYAADVAEGLLAAAIEPGIEARSVDIGSGRLVAIGDILQYLRSIVVPGAPVKVDFVAPRPFEETRVANAAETKRLTGWEAQIPLEEGLNRTYASFRWVAPPASTTIARREKNASGSRRRTAKRFGWLAVAAQQTCESFAMSGLWIS